MNKQELSNLVKESHQDLINFLIAQPEDLWEKSVDNKWTTGQHIKHVVGSLKALNKGLSYPSFILRYKFGKCNRPTRSYEEVTGKYEAKLAKNKDMAKKFNGKIAVVSIDQKEVLIEDFQLQLENLLKQIQKKSDKKLDTLLLPHPLLGKMTLREIMMWLAYHTNEHAKFVKRDYS